MGEAQDWRNDYLALGWSLEFPLAAKIVARFGITRKGKVIN